MSCLSYASYWWVSWNAKLSYPCSPHTQFCLPDFAVAGIGPRLCTLLALPRCRCIPAVHSPVDPTSSPADNSLDLVRISTHSFQSPGEETVVCSVSAQDVRCSRPVKLYLNLRRYTSLSLTVWSGTTPDSVCQNSRLPLSTRCCRVSPSLSFPSSLRAAACVSTWPYLGQRKYKWRG